MTRGLLCRMRLGRMGRLPGTTGPMRQRRLAFALAALTLALAGCRGGSTPAATPGPDGPATPVPTATPFAQAPVPTIVSGPSGAPIGGTSEVTYVVEAGDALSIIAERFGVSVSVIQEANGLTGTDIFVGQTLRIPRQATPASSTPTATATPRPSGEPGIVIYVVQPGDTAFGIALEYDVTLEALEAANGVGPGGLNSLSIGQEIRVPRPN
jgi:LysM repeat protein